MVSGDCSRAGLEAAILRRGWFQALSGVWQGLSQGRATTPRRAAVYVARAGRSSTLSVAVSAQLGVQFARFARNRAGQHEAYAWLFRHAVLLYSLTNPGIGGGVVLMESVDGHTLTVFRLTLID
jgi:hypothetical protein